MVFLSTFSGSGGQRGAYLQVTAPYSPARATRLAGTSSWPIFLKMASLEEPAWNTSTTHPVTRDQVGCQVPSPAYNLDQCGCQLALALTFKIR